MQAIPFHSARLHYAAITPADDEGFLLAMSSDTISQMNGPLLPKPGSVKSAKASREEWLEKTCLLAVKICLRAEDAPSDGNKGAAEAAAAAAPASFKTPGDGETGIGFICLSADAPMFARHRSSMIAITLLPAYHNKGYGTEAIEWALDYGFSIAGLHRIGIGAYGWNEGARRLYDRMGFRLEEHQIRSKWHRGRWWDTFGWAMLEEEWRERRAGNEVVLGRQE